MSIFPCTLITTPSSAQMNITNSVKRCSIFCIGKYSFYHQGSILIDYNLASSFEMVENLQESCELITACFRMVSFGTSGY